MNAETLDTEALYIALTHKNRATQHRRLTYRCTSHKCLLLDVIDAGPLGIIVHRPRYKYSDTVNQKQSSDAGRKANTIDGNRRWKAHTFNIAQSGLAASLIDTDDIGDMSLSCDHVLNHMLTAKKFWDDWEKGATNVRISPNNLRYAV